MLETQTTFGADAQPGTDPPHVGEVLSGVFKLTRLIGRGGMSYVFEAEDAMLSRKVAIKIADEQTLGLDVVLHEARALAAVHHAGLPVVHGVGVHRGWTYLVLERLYGVSLEEHLVQLREPMRLEDGIDLLVPVAEVLAAVHGAGLAHRDLKPGNVMMCPGRVVLLDFGIVLPEINAGPGSRCGTPRYIAPELVTDQVTPGSARHVDTYAFGVMAYEMFAGRPPFHADSLVELLEHHIHTPAPRLSDLRPDLPRRLDHLIAMCLHKDPQERPRDMQEVAWALRNLTRPIEGSGPVRMPRAHPTRETYRDAERTEDTSVPSTRWEVLVVDDDADNRTGLASALKARGYRTRVAVDGHDALELIRRTGWRPSVILLDLMMPVMDGNQFLLDQAADPLIEGIPVLLVTAQPPSDVRPFGAVRGVMHKPLAIPTLLDLVGEVCRGGSDAG